MCNGRRRLSAPEPNGGIVHPRDLTHGALRKPDGRQIPSLTRAVGQSDVVDNGGHQHPPAHELSDELFSIVEPWSAHPVTGKLKPIAVNRQPDEAVDELRSGHRGQERSEGKPNPDELRVCRYWRLRRSRFGAVNSRVNAIRVFPKNEVAVRACD